VAKRKIFTKVSSKPSTIVHSKDASNRVVIPLEVIPPAVTTVSFPHRDNASSREKVEFGKWYGIGIDAITYVCQRQIERFLATHDGDRSSNTVTAYCSNGLAYFLPFCALEATTLGRPLEIRDIDRSLISRYLDHLASTDLAFNAQRCCYKNAKSVLVALGRRGIVQIETRGEDATFPRNPFPHSHRKSKGEKPLPTAQRKAVAQAAKTAVMPLLHEATGTTSELLGYALLIIALHTGRNTTPLLELKVDCLRPHPKENVKLLVLHKRRGSSAQRVPVRAERTVEDSPTVWTGVVRLIERVKELTHALRNEAPEHLKDRLWLFRAQMASFSTKQGQVVVLSPRTLAEAIRKLVVDHDLKDANGKPLRLNVSILRQTFANRMFELLDGDLVATASATGNSPAIAGQHYMKPGENAEKQWKFMGKAMHEELLTGTLRATEKTPTGRCSDSKDGQFAPKNGATCMNFLDCLRCRNYVVTGDDLYRLFSFYWLVVRERDRVDKRKWQRTYAHIVRMIDRDVVQRGLELKAFRPKQVADARERAKTNPHPFWECPSALEHIQ
jgi:hypothetical protein